MRRKILTVTLMLAMVAALLPTTAGTVLAAGPSVFINEIHYDNAGTDVGEGFEIAGPAGTDLSTYSVVLYNGSGGVVYNTVALSGTIPNQQAGFGTLSFSLPSNGLQNGSPDGLALVNGGTVVEFLSYEGDFTATDGPANGMASVDIGVTESFATAAGSSLQLTGTGTIAADFTWSGPIADTFGSVNTGQIFVGGPSGPSDPVINEFVANHVGADSGAFIELFGDPSTDYSAYSVLEIEGDGTGAGVIDAVLPVGTTNSGGYWIDPEDMENGTLTILLVEGFSGSAGADLDTDDDGTLDSTPWTRVVDDVAVSDGGGSDRSYSSTVLAPFFDGNPFGAGGASRIPNGTDTDTVGDWVRNDFDGFGLAGFPGSPAVGEAENTPGAVNALISVLTDPLGACGDSATLIHDIQGSGLVSTDVGSIREIEGIVTGDFEAGSELSGFFMQEESADFDAHGTTSEGIFVFNSGVGAVNTGDTVRVRGSVAEFFGLTEINNVVSVTVCPATGTTAPAPWSLPVTSVNDWEWVEGMEISISQTLYASGNFTQARFGEVDLSVGGPLENPTNVVAPGAPAIALQDLNDRSRIQLDDASSIQNPLPLPPYLGAGNTLRTGDTLPGITGNVNYSFGAYQLEPTQTVTFTRANPRPGVPDVGGRIEVAAYNVLNYFTTLDGSGSICGPDANQGCRGADNQFEFDRQRAKLVTAISKLDAEVVGLMEIENHPGDVPVADLVAGLNAATAPDTYSYIATGAVGSDAIRQAILYKPAYVTPLGAFETLDSADDPSFDDTLNRPMVVQTFVENATGAVFTVGVNHLKSKGSDCNAVGDPDTGDGQGNCNITRTNAAQAIVDFLATDPTGSGDSDFLIIGDLNAYAMEDPVTTIEAGGYIDLIERDLGTGGFVDGAYSFNFFSQSGYLDHGLASGSMAAQVSDANFWHVNADEPSGLDYNNFNQPGLYTDAEFRSSDHDPVVIGLSLKTAKDLKETTALELGALLPTGNGDDDQAIGIAIDRINKSLNPAWWLDASTLDRKTGNFVFDAEHQSVEQLMKVVTIDVQPSIDALLLADKQLALKQYLATVGGGGDPGRIAQAEGNMADAVANIALGEYSDAVLDFKKAWVNLIKAK
ncbi:MAG: ExeM/NucH family extracellular endonuclease [Acidimicrobiia bacterium]|nr:ExeM/NucH family extracellular endonuclease [Acidimicrobiia bacterium]